MVLRYPCLSDVSYYVYPSSEQCTSSLYRKDPTSMFDFIVILKSSLDPSSLFSLPLSRSNFTKGGICIGAICGTCRSSISFITSKDMKLLGKMICAMFTR